MESIELFAYDRARVEEFLAVMVRASRALLPFIHALHRASQKGRINA